MHKEIFLFSLADCRFDDDYRDDRYLKELEAFINKGIGKSKNVLFFGATIERDFFTSASEGFTSLDGALEVQVDVAKYDGAKSEFNFAIRLKHGEIVFSSPWFDKDCNIAILFRDENLVLRHLFKDEDYLQAIKF
jgi:hypothetical protein